MGEQKLIIISKHIPLKWKIMSVLCLIVVEQAIKFVILEANWNIVYNSGVALSFLSGVSNIALMLSVISIFLVLAFTLRKFKKSIDLIEYSALGLVYAGGISNIIDRLYRGAVIDYISIKNLPVFNLADAIIITGIVALLINTFVQDVRKTRIQSRRS